MKERIIIIIGSGIVGGLLACGYLFLLNSISPPRGIPPSEVWRLNYSLWAGIGVVVGCIIGSFLDLTSRSKL